MEKRILEQMLDCTDFIKMANSYKNTRILKRYTKDMVSFLIGCSFTFEHALLEAGIPVRHIEENHNVPMYITNIPAEPSGTFKGNITVSMRPMTMAEAIKATEITTHFKEVHGTPIHIEIQVKSVSETLTNLISVKL